MPHGEDSFGGAPKGPSLLMTQTRNGIRLQSVSPCGGVPTYAWVSFLPPLETRTLEEGEVGGESGGACLFLTPACSQDVARVLGITLSRTVYKAATGLGPT